VMVFQGSLRRLFAALLVALAVTFVIVHSTDIVRPKNPICAALDPTNDPWLWWWYECGEESGGGGGGGAK